MASFESRQKGYRWSEEVRRERMNRLLGIIRAHVIGSFGIVFPLDLYDEVFRDDEVPEGPNVEWLAPGILAPGAPRPGDAPPNEADMRPGQLRRKSGGAYGLAASMLFMSVSEQVVKLSGEPFVAYTFESGAVGMGQVMKLFQDNYGDENSRRDLRLASLRFEDKRRSLPLQAADVLAYELYKHLPRELGREERPTRYTLRELGTTIPRFWGTVNEAELRKWHYVLGRGLHYSQGSWAK